MKKLVLSLGMAVVCSASMAQVIVSIEEPASIAGFPEFKGNDDGSSWGLASLSGTFLLDTVAVPNDGTPGVNAQGNPASATGCNALPAGSLDGKIAMVFRGDGGNPAIGACGFGVKALNCQNAGAVGVIIVNRDNTTIAMNGGTEGASVTIPVVMLNLTAGQSILTEDAAGTDVLVLIGDKTGYYANDISVFDNTSLRADFGAKPLALATNATDLSLPLGTWVFNYGQNDLTGVMVNTVITRNGTSVYNQTSTGITLASGDSAYVTTPDLALASYQAGEYLVSYNLMSDSTDQFDADNLSTYIFNLGDLWSLVHEDAATTVHVDGYYRASTLPTSQFESCMRVKDANASRVATDGVYFGGFAIGNADTASVSLTGFEVAATVYKWEDADQTATSGTLDLLTEVANGSYFFPGEDVETTVLIPLSDVNTQAPYYRFEDNMTYLVCINSYEPLLYMAYSTKDIYDFNSGDTNLGDDLLRFPIRNDGTTWSGGFGISPSVAFHTQADLNVNEAVVEASAFPNPAKDMITVKVNAAGDATLKVTDMAGRTISTEVVKLANGQFTANVAGMNAGQYVFTLNFANGETSRFNVVVTK